MGKKKDKKVPPSLEQTGLSGIPIIMNEIPYETLEKYQKDLSASERKVLMSVNDYHLSSVNAEHIDRENIKTHILIFCVRFLEKDVCYNIGAINFDKNECCDEKLSQTIACIFEYFIMDLNSLNLTVICSISPPEELYINTIKILAQRPDFERSSNPITYSVRPVMDIVHFFDLYELLMSLQNLFRSHNEIYYLTYEYQEGLRRCHSYWSDILAIMIASEYNCNLTTSRESGAPTSNIFNLAFYYTVRQAQESGKLRMTPTTKDTIYLLDTLCPMVQTIFHMHSVSPSDLEDIYDSLEDVRIIFSSIVFRKIDHLPRPPTNLSASLTAEDISIPGCSKETDIDDPNKQVFIDCERAYREFVEYMAYDGARQPSADGGESMKAKRKRCAEHISKTVKKQFDNYMKSLRNTKTTRRGKGRKSHGAAEIVIDPRSLKPPTIQISKVEEKVIKEQENIKTKKLEKKERQRLKKKLQPSTSGEVVFVKPSTSGDSLAKPLSSASQTSTTEAPIPSAAAVSVSEPSTSAAVQEKPHYTRHRNKPYKNKKRFFKLHIELPDDIERARAPLNCLSTIKGFVKLADSLRKNKIYNIVTNIFSLEHIDFFLRECMKRDKAEQDMDPEESHCSLHYNFLEYNSLSDILVNDIVRLLQTLVIGQEDIVEDISDDVIQTPQSPEIAQPSEEISSEDIEMRETQIPQTLETTEEDVEDEDDLDEYLDQEFII